MQTIKPRAIFVPGDEHNDPVWIVRGSGKVTIGSCLDRTVTRHHTKLLRIATGSKENFNAHFPQR